MAKDTQAKKRKASVPEADGEKSKIKKVKNSTASTDAIEAPAKKRKATEDAAPAKVKKSKTPKSAPAKVADAEPTDDVEAEVEAPAAKKVKVKKAPAKSKSKDIDAESKPKKAVTKETKTTKAKAAEPIEDADMDLNSEDSEDDEEDDDQTQALLKGFDSDGDDEDALNEGGLEEGQPVPERKKLSKAQEKRLKEISDSKNTDKSGVVYIGHIPHGFYEQEMKAYFSQFGKILKLRISRNKKTGASKHYGWIEFASRDVADIVAKAMNNYLMFNHLLKVKVVPDEQIPQNLFKGAGKRFRKIPWNKIEGMKISQGVSEEVWDGRVVKEENRRQEKAKKLQSIGYEFEAPKIKSAKGVSKKTATAIEPAADEQTVSAIEAAPTTEKPTKSKKKAKPEDVVDKKKTDDMTAQIEDLANQKKANRAAGAPPTFEDVEENLAAVALEAASKPEKAKKAKKQTKSAAKEAVESVEEETPVVALEPKSKNAKKEKKPKAEESGTVLEEEVATAKVKRGKKGKKDAPGS